MDSIVQEMISGMKISTSETGSSAAMVEVEGNNSSNEHMEISAPVRKTSRKPRSKITKQ